MSKFRIFLSSPVAGFEPYRAAVKEAARDARHGGLFDFFLYEEHEIETTGFASPCEAIFSVAGVEFDAIFIFFKDKVGDGTMDELRYFETHIIPNRPHCKVWWSKVESGLPYADSVIHLLKTLNNDHSLEIPEAHYPRNIEAEHLRGRFAVHLWRLAAKLGEASFR